MIFIWENGPGGESPVSYRLLVDKQKQQGSLPTEAGHAGCRPEVLWVHRQNPGARGLGGETHASSFSLTST